MQVTKTLNERITQYCQITLETMAYAGTGDVLKIQQMLAIAGEHIEVEEGEAWKVASWPLHYSQVCIGQDTASMHSCWSRERA